MVGCADNDGDGYANAGEAFPTTRLNGQTRMETDLTAITLSLRVETIRMATIPTCSHQIAPNVAIETGMVMETIPAAKTEIGSLTTRHNGGMKMEMDLVTILMATTTISAQ